MGFFKKLLGAAAPIVGGILGGPVGAAIGGGVAGLIGGHETANSYTSGANHAGQTAIDAGNRASQTALGGSNYFAQGPISNYANAGGAAVNQQAGLLGIGGDPAAAQQGYQNYLGSVGFQGQLHAGQQAITSSRAASGLLGSGSTAKALQAYGTQLGQQNFNNYLGQLGGVAGMGLQAGGMIGGAQQQAANQAAQYQYGAGQNAAGYQANAVGPAAEAKSSGWDQLLGGLGSAYDAWQAGRSGRAQIPGLPAGAAPNVVPSTPMTGGALVRRPYGL